MKKIFIAVLTGVAFLGGYISSEGMAQTGSPPQIKATVALEKSVYLTTEPLNITIVMENQGSDVITSKGFQDRPFHLNLTFVDPDQKGINANNPPMGDPAPPSTIPIDIDGDGDIDQMAQVEAVEILPAGWVLSVTIPDTHDYYTLTKAGRYSVKAVIPMRTYSDIYKTISGVDYALIDSFDWSGALESNSVEFSFVADADGDGYSYPVADARISQNSVPDCNDSDPAVNPGMSEITGDGKDNDCNPATPDIVAAAPGTISVKAEKHTVGTGSKPITTKAPLAGLPVRVYDKSADSCVRKLGVSWQNYKSIWLSCIPIQNGIGTTNSSGIVNFAPAPGDYIVLGEYNPDGLSLNGDEIYMGVSTGELTSGQTMQKYMQIIVKADGKNVPAKYTAKTGSLLLIIEPEYIEWSGTQELYPFIFESIGDWTVTTSVDPPEGFIADKDSLTANVNTDLEALQFTIKDIGSKWVETGVTHIIKHKDKTEITTSSVGIRCSGKLAKKKGFNWLCQKINK